MTAYEDARARVNTYLKSLNWGKGEGAIVARRGLYDLRYEDVALLAKVPETPVVGVQPEAEALVSAGTPSLDGQYAEIRVLKAFANALESRIERLEAGRRMNDLPRVSFVHDAGCPAGGHTPPIPRGGSSLNEGSRAPQCTCKVGPGRAPTLRMQFNVPDWIEFSSDETHLRWQCKKCAVGATYALGSESRGHDTYKHAAEHAAGMHAGLANSE